MLSPVANAPARHVPPDGAGEYPFLRPSADGAGLGELDDYLVLRVLGAGGMGVVFLARERRLDREVALKVLHPHAALDEVTRAFFVREGRVMAALEHENIVPVYRVGEANGVLFIAMPVLRGCSLDAWLRANPQRPVADVLRVGREIATGLAAAHAKGLIHRDIKPANVWLETRSDTPPPCPAPGGENESRLPPGFKGVKILDFGLARPIQTDQNLTSQEFVVGTPGYLAPELVRGDPSTPACDLFSLGALLYQCFCDEVPFRSNTALATLFTTASAPPPPLGGRVPHLPVPVADFVMRLLEKNPAHRPGPADHVAARLGELERDPESAASTVAVRRDAPAVAGGRARIARGAGVAVVLLLGCLAAFLGLQTEPERRPEPGGPGVSEVPELAPHEEFTGLSDEAAGAVYAGTGGTIAALAVDGWLFEWDADAPQRPRRLWRAHPARGYGLSATPDGRVLLTGGNDADEVSEVVGWDRATGRAAFSLKGGVTWTNVIAVNRDGTRAVATGLGGKSITFDPRTGARVDPFRSDEWLSAVAISPDGTRAVTVSQWERFGRVWDVSNGLLLDKLETRAPGTRAAAFSPDGRTVALGFADGTVRLWDADTGRAGPVLTGHTDLPNGLVFSPDGARLVSGCRGGAVRVWDARTGAALARCAAHTGPVMAVAFAPDGREFLSAGRDRRVLTWATP